MLVRFVFLSALLTLAAARTSYNGWVTENVITGTTLQAPEGFAWDDQGFMYVTDAYTSVVAKIPVSALPINSEASFVWKKKYDQSSDQANGIIFKDGRLYLTQLSGGRVLEISPVDGSVIRVVTTAINGPIDMHLDPLSGDVFVSALNGAAIHRIQNIGTVPIVSVYANFQNGIDGFSFSADGSIYACLLGSDQVWKALGTNQASPSPSFFFNKVRPDGNAVTSCNGVESLIVDSATTGSIHSVPLLNPSAATVIVDGVSTKMDLARVGPDGKFYISMHYDNNQVRAFRLFNTGCTFTTDPSTQPGNFPGSSPCAGGNCSKATAAPECAAVAFHSASKCATLSFSTTTSDCPQL